MSICPRCGGELKNIQRLRMDRALSLVYPVRRFLCKNPHCNFEGCLADQEKVTKKSTFVFIAVSAILAVLLLLFLLR